MDAHAAFLNNVNAIINLNDLEDLDRVMEIALREFNHYFMNHRELRSEILSVGDGLGYAVKIP